MAWPSVERRHRGALEGWTAADGRRAQCAGALSLAAAGFVPLFFALAIVVAPARASDSSSDGSSSSGSSPGSGTSEGESARGESTPPPGAFEPRPPLFPKLSGSSSNDEREKALRDVLDLVRRADPAFKGALRPANDPTHFAMSPELAQERLFGWYQANRARAASTGKLSAADARDLDRFWGERSRQEATARRREALILNGLYYGSLAVKIAGWGASAYLAVPWTVGALGVVGVQVPTAVWVRAVVIEMQMAKAASALQTANIVRGAVAKSMWAANAYEAVQANLAPKQAAAREAEKQTAKQSMTGTQTFISERPAAESAPQVSSATLHDAMGQYAGAMLGEASKP